MSYEEFKQEAERRLEEILRTGELLGVDLDLRRGHEVKWAEPLNAGWYSIPGGSRKWAVAKATVSPGLFLRMQAKTRPAVSTFDFVNQAYDETVRRAERSLETGRNDVPTPVIEVHEDGTVVQEGRSRAKGAVEAGRTRMPVWVAVRAYK